MNDEDLWTLDAMDRFGGSFVRCLSNLARHADRNNLLKIKATWLEYWKEYKDMGEQLKNDEK